MNQRIVTEKAKLYEETQEWEDAIQKKKEEVVDDDDQEKRKNKTKGGKICKGGIKDE